MNDRFKFRVYLKAHKQMCNVHTLHTGTNKVIISTRYGNSSVQINDYNILMQSTGLKDKNGKLIYEGDIVKKQEWQDEYKLGVVFWDDMWGHFDVTKMSMFSLVNRAEVIGNIYENKELLNG